MPLAHHIMLRLIDSRVIATNVAARRELARTVLEVGNSYRLIALGGADTHIHAEALCSLRDANQFARSVEVKLGYRLCLPIRFERARIKPIEDQGHLNHTFNYCLRQEQHHGTELDPLHDASNLPDLLGMRVNGAYTITTVRAHLPRVNRTALLQHLGFPDLDARGVCDVDLADAAAAAFALPDLAGRSRDVVRARRAAVHAMRPRASTSRIAELLAVTPRTVRNLGAQLVTEAEVRAVLLQLRLRTALAQRSLVHCTHGTL
jgi:hypothetical protein